MSIMRFCGRCGAMLDDYSRKMTCDEYKADICWDCAEEFEEWFGFCPGGTQIRTTENALARITRSYNDVGKLVEGVKAQAWEKLI